MRTFLKILKFVLIFALAVSVSFVLGLTIGVLVKGGDVSFGVILSKIKGLSWEEVIGVPLVSVLSMLVGGALQIILHELGHLIGGLLSGYRFLSFQAMGIVLVNDGGKLRVKRFNMDGALGQCLMTPPDVPSDKMPVVVYNAGGVVMNVIATAICVTIMLCAKDLSPFAYIFFGVIALIGLYFIIVNGVPMCISGLPNDGYNMLKLRHNEKSREAFASVLRLCVLLSEGVRPRDIPLSIFQNPEEVDFSQPIQVNLLLGYASTLMDMGRYDESERIFLEIIEREKKIKIFVLESKCELSCLLMMRGETDEASSLIDEKELKMVKSMSGSMSSKQRYLFFRALHCEEDRKKAEEIYNTVDSRRNNYLIKGEVDMDLEMMRAQL